MYKTAKITLPWTISSVDHQIQSNLINVAVGSFTETNQNQVAVFEHGEETKIKAEAQLSLPPSQIRWYQDQKILISDQKLKVFQYEPQQNALTQIHILQDEFQTGPITAFDYHQSAMNIVVSCSSDKTITINDLQRGMVVEKKKCHKSPITGVSFSYCNRNMFSTVSYDGTILSFDLRSLKNTIRFLRDKSRHFFNIAQDFQEGVYTAFSDLNSNLIFLYDVRNTTTPLMLLNGHNDFISQISFCELVRYQLLSSSDDGSVIAWDCSSNRERYVHRVFESNLQVNNICLRNQQVGIIAQNNYINLPTNQRKKITYSFESELNQKNMNQNKDQIQRKVRSQIINLYLRESILQQNKDQNTGQFRRKRANNRIESLQRSEQTFVREKEYLEGIMSLNREMRDEVISDLNEMEFLISSQKTLIEERQMQNMFSQFSLDYKETP